MEKYCYGAKRGYLCHRYGGVCRYCCKSVKVSPQIYDCDGDTYYDYGSEYNV